MSKETKIGIDVAIINITNSIEIVSRELEEMKNSLKFLKSLKRKGVIINDK